jgi:hypothetical protein
VSERADFAALAAASDEHAARVASGAAPSVVRDTLLGGQSIQIAGLDVHAWTLGIGLLLEAIDHPELTGRLPKISDNTAALYIFCQPETAYAAWQAGDFEASAFRFALKHVPMHAVDDLMSAVRLQIQRGKKAIPGQHHGEESEDSDPLAPSRPETPGSAGN